MSLYLGSQLLAGVATSTIYNAHDLFDHKWTDHLLNDQSWLRADIFSWQDGTVYTNAYSHLEDDMYGKTQADVLSEIVGSYTVYYYLADDGHKICTPDQETTIANIYNESGVAWYYIWDTTNQRFKLPRELPITDKSKGNGIALGFTDGKGNNASLYNGLNSGGSYYGFSGLAKYGSKLPKHGDAEASLATDSAVGITTDQTKSGIISHRANENGQQYLYFYVGQFSQSATEQTAGLNAELFNRKMDLDLGNATTTAKETIVGWGIPDYENPTVNGASLASGDNTITITQASYVLARTPSVGSGSGYIKIQTASGNLIDIEYVDGGTAKQLSTRAFLGAGTYIINVTGAGTYYVYPLKGVV